MNLWTRTATGAVIVGAGLVSCTGSTDLDCPDIMTFAITASVVDSVNSLNAVPGSTLIVRTTTGSHADTMVANVAFPQLFAGEQPGTYDVTISKAQYQTWTRNGVVVSGDGCGKPETVSLLAKLIRATP